MIPAETDAYGEIPKKLTTRMVRDNFINCVHIWTQLSRGSFGYIFCAIDIVDAFLMVPQKKFDPSHATGDKLDFMLGKLLPGQGNGSQMWHEASCCFPSCELKINDISQYPSLLGSTHCKCLMLLHADDVSCRSTKN